MSDGLPGDGVAPAGGASALTGELGGDEQAWQAMARQRATFEFFAGVIFGLDVTRLGAVYLKDETKSAWEAWQETEENETMPALGPERETLKELARLSIENLRLKQTTLNVPHEGPALVAGPLDAVVGPRR